jgi:hypothetical protein
VQNEDGTERKLKIPKRVRRWWTEQQGGTILLTIRYGNKVIELEKGKNTIKLPSKADLEPTLQNIKKANALVSRISSFSGNKYVQSA